MADITQPPKPSVGDHLHAAVRVGLGAIPVVGAIPVGGAAVELFNAIVTPPIERRRDEWRASVGRQLEELVNAGFLRADELSNNEAFITTLMQASQAAVRNHQSEKLEGLRNAVANAALPHPPEESIQQIFIQLLDDFTVWHLRILKLFHDPRAWFQTNGKAPPSFAISSDLERVLLAAYPELENRRNFYDRIVADLTDRGLFAGSGLHTMMSASGAFERRATEMGDQFLDFIQKPMVPGEAAAK
jgi:hypothetical protein